MFSNKSKTADTEWKIKIFKQKKKYIVDFIIEFKVLAIKADMDELHTIFLLKKCASRHNQDNTRVPTNSSTRNVQEMEGSNYLS